MSTDITLGAMASFIIGMPEHQPENTLCYTPSSPLAPITISSGTTGHNKQPVGLPYGVQARTLMLYLCDYARRVDYDVPLGVDARNFMIENLGYQSSSTHDDLAEQLKRIVACRIDHPDLVTEDVDKLLPFNKALIDQSEKLRSFNKISALYENMDWRRMIFLRSVLWGDESEKNAAHISLNPLYKNIHIDDYILGIPRIDFEAIKAMNQGSRKRGSLAQNTYVFLADVLYRINKDEPKLIAWDVLYLLLGEGYRELPKFSYALRRILNDKVLPAYPRANIDISIKEGLYLRNSKTPC